MQRVTITLDDELMGELDELIAARGYTSRSEAIRDLARAGVRQAVLESDAAPDCIAALVYIYDHDSRDLAARLDRLFHAHHDLSVATMRVPLDHDTSLAVAMLRGLTKHVLSLGDRILIERGVRHGRMHVIPVIVDADHHQHAEGAPIHGHVRAR